MRQMNPIIGTTKWRFQDKGIHESLSKTIVIWKDNAFRVQSTLSVDEYNVDSRIFQSGHYWSAGA